LVTCYPSVEGKRAEIGLANRHDCAAIIMATSVAHMVRTFELTTIGAFLIRVNFQRIMATTHAAP
jgi:hypothetical protein